MSRKTINDWRDLRPIWEQPWPGHDGPHRCEVCLTTWTETT